MSAWKNLPSSLPDTFGVRNLIYPHPVLSGVLVLVCIINLLMRSHHLKCARFRASPSPCWSVGKPSEKGLGKMWLKYLGPSCSIHATTKHCSTKYWLENVIIMPLKAFTDFMQDFGAGIGCLTYGFLQQPVQTLHLHRNCTWEHFGAVFRFYVDHITTVCPHTTVEPSTKCCHCAGEQTVFSMKKSRVVTSMTCHFNSRSVRHNVSL